MPILDRLVSAALGLAAIAIAVAVVHREFIPPPNNPLIRPDYIADWKDLTRSAIRTGDATAKLQLIEFADFQCPVCAMYEATLRRARARYEPLLSVNFVHFPLTMHRFARDAALAAECAESQGRFEPMRDLLFSRQDSLGVIPWNTLARRAAVPDVPDFERCMAAKSRPRIEQGYEMARALKLEGTPTVIVNGWKFRGAITDSVLFNTMDDLLRGKTPRYAK